MLRLGVSHRGKIERHESRIHVPIDGIMSVAQREKLQLAITTTMMMTWKNAMWALE